VAGTTLIQTTSNGTAGINAARGADCIFAGTLVTAEATVRAILRQVPSVITLVAMGRSNGTIRADEDELCALYLRARLEGRQPNVAAIRAVLATMPPPPNPKLVAVRVYDLKDHKIAAEVDALAFAISVRRGSRMRRERTFNRLLNFPRRASARSCRRLPTTVL